MGDAPGELPDRFHLLGLAKLLLKLLALGPLLALLQGSLYCGHQTGGPRF